MPSPEQSDPAAIDDPPVHHVASPMGTEGPYTIAELRGLLSAGRIHAEDRVMREGTSKTRLVSDLVPDAAELTAKAERVRRRSTSGAHPTQKAGTGSQARRFRTPLPTAAPASGEPAAAMQPAPAPVPAQPASRARMALMLVILVTLVAGLAAFLLLGGNGASVLGPAPVQQPVGIWRIAKLGTAGGPWTLAMDETTLTITAPDGSTTQAAVIRTVVDDRHVQLALTPPHPVLGASIALAGAAAVEVAAGSLSGRGEPVR